MADPRRTFAPTVVAGLASAALTALAAGRPWGTVDTLTGGAHRVVVARGTDVAPQALALALVTLATWGIVLVVRAKARRVMAVVGLICSLLVVASVAEAGHRIAAVSLRLAGNPASATHGVSAWFAVTGVATVVTAGCFVAAWRLAPGWPVMGARYDAPSTATPETDEDLWRAQDRGHDPTA
ncbi:MAG: Trp biosynthesis-associated membrane protein [Nocardioidaceae bacterium]